jgi:hypothetical protein
MLKTAARGFGHVHFFVRKHCSSIDHRSPHTRTKVHMNTHGIDLFTGLFSANTLSNDVLTSVSVLDHLVKPFSVVVPLDGMMERQHPSVSRRRPDRDSSSLFRR